ncbi:MAG TPA: hypothetical protein VGX23_27680 [Actinocrinis sp.]|nr:hypothetical protein [Actinocrinis sp.]
MIGLDVLGQVGHGPGRPFLEETLPIAIEVCADWRPDVVQSAVVALGHLAVLGQVGRRCSAWPGVVIGACWRC